jgi:5-methyltetrahydrofolate--homocysteine methyltransferase
MSDLREIQAAITAAQQATNLPVTATMSFDMHGRTMMGVRPEAAVKALWPMGVLAVGVNCGRTLEENLVALTAMRTAMPEATLLAKPNAGLPRVEDMEAIYEVTPEIMAGYAVKFAAQHVKMLGGCCGSNPSHIRAIKEELKAFMPPPLELILAQNLAANGTNGAAQADQRQRRRERRREKT